MSDTTLTSDEQQLLADVKNYLRITWQDENTDNNILGYIRRGEARLQQTAGASLDFTQEELPRTLLLDYCRYANSQALEMFEKNFQSELLELNIENQFTIPKKLIVVSTAGTSSGYTTIGVSPQLDNENSYIYKLGTDLLLPCFFDVCDVVSGYIEWNGIDEIQAQNNDIVIVEVDSEFKAIKAGKTTTTVR